MSLYLGSISGHGESSWDSSRRNLFVRCPWSQNLYVDVTDLEPVQWTSPTNPDQNQTINVQFEPSQTIRILCYMFYRLFVCLKRCKVWNPIPAPSLREQISSHCMFLKFCRYFTRQNSVKARVFRLSKLQKVGLYFDVRGGDSPSPTTEYGATSFGRRGRGHLWLSMMVLEKTKRNDRGSTDLQNSRKSHDIIMFF